MNLDAFKLAAKRLRKQVSELNSRFTPTDLTQSEALDMMARVLGYRNYYEGRMHLAATPQENSSAKKVSSIEPIVLGIAGPPGCGKTLITKEIIANALAQGIPVRLLDALGHGDYTHFSGLLGAKSFKYPFGEDAQAAWQSDAPFVYLHCGSPDECRALDFAPLELPSNTLFVCDEARFFTEDFKPLGGMCILTTQFLRDLPTKFTAALTFRDRNWREEVPQDQISSMLADVVSRALLRPVVDNS